MPMTTDNFDLTLSLCPVGVERRIDEEGRENVVITDQLHHNPPSMRV